MRRSSIKALLILSTPIVIVLLYFAVIYIYTLYFVRV